MNNIKLIETRRFTRAARLASLGALLAGVVGCVDAPGFEDDGDDVSDSEEAEATGVASSALLPNNCAQRSSQLFDLAGSMVAFVPGVGSVASKAIALFGAIRGARCTNNQAVTLTMEQLRAEITAISGQVVDEALRQRLVDATDSLLRVLEFYQHDLQRIDELDAAERESLAEDLERFAIDALFLESDTKSLEFPIIPVFIEVASLKLGLLHVAHDLREPGADRERLANLIEGERQVTQDILLERERSLSRRQRLERAYYFNSSYSIDVKVTNGGQTIYLRDWDCKKKAFGSGCDNRYSRRDQYFYEGRELFRDVRTKQNETIDASYLAFKNALFNTPGPAFKLESGVSNHTDPISIREENRACLRASAGGAFSVPACGPDAADDDEDQLWGLVPGTGQLYNLGQKVCLQTDDEGALTSAPCEDLQAPEPRIDENQPTAPVSRQSWGHHPNGYFMHLASGLCLSLDHDVVMPQNQQVTQLPGSGVTLAPCDFGSVGYHEHVSYYAGNVVTIDLGEDVWKVVPTSVVDWQVE